MTNLDACSQEPIHIPGAIQPHGALLAISDADRVCCNASRNLVQFCGLDASPIGRAIDEFLIPGNGGWDRLLDSNPLPSVVRLVAGDQPFVSALHRNDGLVVIELERSEPADAVGAASTQDLLGTAVRSLREAGSLADLCDTAARVMAELSGHERVMVYRFDSDWHGEVIGECLLDPEVRSYRHHHFPASDIPEQARALYLRNSIRTIPDAGYKPVPIEPDVHPVHRRPLDLSHSVLRSVSPVHIAYLKNMEVGASMSVSLIVEGKLWGLIACHHRTPRAVPPQIRSACHLLGQIVSLELRVRREIQTRNEYVRVSTVQRRFFDFLGREDHFVDALLKYAPELLEYLHSSTAIVYINSKTTVLGDKLGDDLVDRLMSWVKSLQVDSIHSTDRLSEKFEEAQEFQKVASGLLAIRLSPVDQQYLVFLRPEVLSEITWAGNPEMPKEGTPDLNPRRSFASWHASVTGRSLPWSDADLQAAQELLNAINALVLRRSQRLIALNAELERRNTDLNSFAYIASHDLREPLRGIANYAAFTLEDFADELPEEAKRKICKIQELAGRSEELLVALSRFSKMGRIEISRKPAAMDEIVSEVLETLGHTIEEKNVEIRRPSPLPEVECDRILVREVLLNLIINAIRYNRSDKPFVEISANRDGPVPVFVVRDNGIGISKKHQEDVFRIFRRLHSQQEFGGGTGAGLAIVKSIVERHGGTIWIEQPRDGGTAFHFTLS